ncbi:hypothetical protein [Lacrimispora sp.]|uniref:hypothetical protein n=1 Tax=Lacrimispora sp. TaxID=2719234 RepID=UPI0028968B74|nr:hypothetical protein [Lacrimispora sp.]
MIHISKDGTGDFKSIGKALRFLPSDHTDEPTDLQRFTKEAVLSCPDNWNPQKENGS